MTYTWQVGLNEETLESSEDSGQMSVFLTGCGKKWGKICSLGFLDHISDSGDWLLDKAPKGAQKSAESSFPSFVTARRGNDRKRIARQMLLKMDDPVGCTAYFYPLIKMSINQTSVHRNGNDIVCLEQTAAIVEHLTSAANPGRVAC